MAVLGLLSVALEVPDIQVGVDFYADAGLVPEVEAGRARFSCPGQERACIELVAGDAKRLHHIQLRCDDLGQVRDAALAHGGHVIDAPSPFSGEGLWLTDPHGMRLHLVERPEGPAEQSEPLFSINSPGHVVRTRRSAILPKAAYPAVRPRKLGHTLVFTPDVERSISFFVDALGMGLADRSQDVIAFLCCRKNSDHHVVAFAKSQAVGFHHVSFLVGDPDEVGRAGALLRDLSGRGDWGFGRHTIGSNFFHYIQDPWGSWFEYYVDMDYIDDHSLWTPTNYDLGDSLASWGPAVPHDFVKNYEVDAQ